MGSYFGYDDLLVPKDQGMSSDGFQSPDGWSNWGLNSTSSFDFSRKNFLSDANLNPQQLRLDSRTCCSQLEMESSILDRDQSSCSSFAGGPAREDSLHHTTTAVSSHRPDYQSKGLAGIENMDDHVMNSLLDDLQEMENLQPSPCFSSESQNRMIPADELWTEATLDSDSISSNDFAAGSSCTRSCQQSMDRGTSQVLASHFSPGHVERRGLQQLKVPPFTVSVTSEDDCMNVGVQDQNQPSREELALNELQLVMAQLTTKTRLCFRDALYRLAKNSRPNEVAYEELGMDIPSWRVAADKLRDEGMEPQTNSIDRAIANLMFNKVDVDVMDYLISTPATSDQEFLPNDSNPQQFTSVHQNQIFPGDAEDPVSGHRVWIGEAADAGMHVSRTAVN
ncbi:Protein LNK3 [Linum perenne]